MAARSIGKGRPMKVQDFAYQVAIRTIALLEETQHYRIPEELRKQVLAKIQAELTDLIQKAQ
jgi:hypothetical protein